jgi:DNA-directed RNA polymerase specialized sigma24 family protein
MHVSGYTYAEIGDFLGLHRNAVRGRIARARERIRGALAARLQSALSSEERDEHD